MVGGEQRAGATEAGGDLVEDQQHAGLIAGLGAARPDSGVVEPHPTGTLDDRLDDDGGELIGVRGDGRPQACAYRSS